MTDEAKRCVEALRMCPVLGYRCTNCPVYTPGKPCQNELNAANLIESLSTELEQVKRERDAAVKQLLEIDKNNPFACSYCKHDEVCDGRLVVCGDCGMTSCPCNTCINHSNWQWRGVKED